MPAAQLSHEQSLPSRHIRSSYGEQGHHSMLPPPPPVPGPGGRFRPAMDTKLLNTQTVAPQGTQQRTPPLVSQQRQFAVPQTPRRSGITNNTHTNRFMPSSHGRSTSGAGAVTSSDVPGTSSGGHRMSFVSGNTKGFG